MVDHGRLNIPEWKVHDEGIPKKLKGEIVSAASVSQNKWNVRRVTRFEGKKRKIRPLVVKAEF